MMGLRRLMESALASRYEFQTCFQNRPAGGFNPRLILEMAKEIKKHHPDILHVRGLQNEGFHGVLAGKVAGCRRILVSAHGFMGDNPAPPSRLRQRIVADYLEPFTLRHSTGVYCVCQSAAQKKMVVQNARRHFGVIHNGVPLPELRPAASALRQSMGLSESDIVAICVGRITRAKGLLDLLEATGILAKRGQENLKVVLVGDGPDMELIQNLARRLPPGRVVCLGQRDDVIELLRASDFFVFPSLAENLANALLEAMSVGKAVIASDVGGNPEVVVPMETGLLVPPGNPVALADAMQEMVRNVNLRNRMGLAGRKRVEDHFSMNALVEKLDKVYRQLLAS